jgi:hypothetical protein
VETIVPSAAVNKRAGNPTIALRSSVQPGTDGAPGSADSVASTFVKITGGRNDHRPMTRDERCRRSRPTSPYGTPGFPPCCYRRYAWIAQPVGESSQIVD